MNESQILKALQPIFEEVFAQSPIELQADTAAKDIDNWDSLNHAVLIDRIEQYFQVKFDLMDMLNMQHVGAICERILAKKSNDS
ncbi:MAG: acyl carrier protein [Bacteroidota bacterium]